MYKKTITYTDYDGNERTEDFYFNINKAELMEMQLLADGGMDKYLDQIVKAKDVPTLVMTFKDIILKSYGVKSPDGKRFIKSKEITEEFTQTEAYSKLFMELATDDKAAVEFVRGITPTDIKEDLEKMAVKASE